MKFSSEVDLYEKIANTHYHTDYSSIDFIYPPVFAWKTDKKNKVQNLLQQKRVNLWWDFIFNLYVHFPYCEQKCLFCRQYSQVPKDISEFSRYLSNLSKEIKLYSKLFKKPKIGHIYFGGGTPTLFNLKKVMEVIKKNFVVVPNHQFNVESTFACLGYKKLMELKNIGVNRLVLGIQSFDEKVLKAINRKQDKRKFCDILRKTRQIGIETVNAELVYGLPKQTIGSFIKDLQSIINLDLDSIHIYPYLQTPLTILGRREYPSGDPNLKEEMKKKGINLLEKNGYYFYGDDFAKKSIHRNRSLARDKYPRHGGSLALGVSSIGNLGMVDRTWLRYINTFDLSNYEDYLKNNKLPIEKYYLLDKEEKIRAHVIQGIKYKELELNSFNKKFGIDFLKKFNKELKILRDLNKAKIKDKKIIIKEWTVYSRAFYSKKVFERCRKIISKKHSHLKKSYY